MTCSPESCPARKIIATTHNLVVNDPIVQTSMYEAALLAKIAELRIVGQVYEVCAEEYDCSGLNEDDDCSIKDKANKIIENILRTPSHNVAQQLHEDWDAINGTYI